nr:septum formation initiator family protein [Thermosulfurimonas sp. F29]
MKDAVSPRVYRPGRAGSREGRCSPGHTGRWRVLVTGAILLGLVLGLFFDWRYRTAEREMARLMIENARLSRKIEALKRDPALYEEIARKKYGYVRKNERLIIFERR